MGAVLDQDVIIIGSGPAGLTAATRLAEQNVRVLVLEKEEFGGLLKKVEWFRGHPDHPQGIAGPVLAAQLLDQAELAGVRLEYGEIDAVESYSTCHSVSCVNGRNYLASAVILAGGRRPLKLDIPGEQEFLNKGVIHCVLCDAGLFAGRTVAVCGGGDAGIIEALTIARFAARVIVIEKTSALTARDLLQERVRVHPKIEFMFDTIPERINGNQVVESITTSHVFRGERNTFPVDGIIVDVGTIPNTDFLEDVIQRDSNNAVIVNERMTTNYNTIFAAGDLRSKSDLNLGGAIKDGVTVADSLLALLAK